LASHGPFAGERTPSQDDDAGLGDEREPLAIGGVVAITQPG